MGFAVGGKKFFKECYTLSIKCEHN